MGTIAAMRGKGYAKGARPGSCSSPHLVDFIAWVTMHHCRCGVQRQLHFCSWVLEKAKYGFHLDAAQLEKIAPGMGGFPAQSQYTSSPTCSIGTQTPRWKHGCKSAGVQTFQSTCEQAVQCEGFGCTTSGSSPNSGSTIAHLEVLSVSQKRRRRRHLLRQRRLADQ